MKHCASCTCDNSDLLADPVADEVQRIREWARDGGVMLIFGDSLRLSDAGRYAGRATKTVCNWVYAEVLPSKTLNGRRYVSVQNLAEYICASK